MVERMSDLKKEAIICGIEKFVGAVFTDDRGVVWTCDGKGTITPSDGGEVRKVRDIVRVR